MLWLYHISRYSLLSEARLSHPRHRPRAQHAVVQEEVFILDAALFSLNNNQSPPGSQQLSYPAHVRL
jgi:hypothetical protein